MSKEYAIVAKDLRKHYGKVKVLEGIDLRVEKGTVVALLGPNGAGKTTMVRILTTLLDADGGSAKVGGYDVDTQADKVRGVIGLTGQYAAVDEYLSGRENLQMMGRLYRLSRSDSRARAIELLEQFGLTKAADRIAKTYSGGMRRRLDLAASLIATPPIIFLDEPTTGLDPRSRISMWEVIQQLVDSGATILLTTQYLEEADQLADRIVVIDGGKVIAEGTADQLKAKVGKERLELVISPTSDFAKALTIMADRSLKSDEAARSISIANDGGVQQVKEVLVRMEKHKIAIDSLSLHKPTLDDVFLELTGRQATMAESDEKETK